MKCDRCLKETSMHVMSKFNTQDLCAVCKDEEEKHPLYAVADAAELEAAKNKVMNYPGVGLPAELREKFIEKVMASQEEFFGNINWNRYDGGYHIDTAEVAACEYCKETIVGQSFQLHDVSDFVHACLRCGDLVLAGFQKGAEEYVVGLDEDRKKIAELLK